MRQTALGIVAAATAVAVAYALCKALQVPMLWYDPVLSTWSFGDKPGPAAMDWFGRSLVSLVAGAVAYRGIQIVVRATPTRSGVLRGLTAIAAAALIGSAVYEGHRLAVKAASAQEAMARVALRGAR